jgi:hypothetical protein
VKIDDVDYHIGTVGIDGPDLGALEGRNTDQPVAAMRMHGQGELDARTATSFTGAWKARNVVRLTSRELIARERLQSMRRPAG